MDQLLERVLNPVGDDAWIREMAKRCKAEQPEKWQALAAEFFGLRTDEASLLLPEAVALRVAVLEASGEGAMRDALIKACFGPSLTSGGYNLDSGEQKSPKM